MNTRFGADILPTLKSEAFLNGKLEQFVMEMPKIWLHLLLE